MEEVLSEIAPCNYQKSPHHLYCGRHNHSHIAKHLNGDVPVIRVMPNTPALIQEGASVLSVGKHATEAHLKSALKLFSSWQGSYRGGALMDAVTGLSGSGPAYVFLFIEALADAGVKMGLPRSTCPAPLPPKPV